MIDLLVTFVFIPWVLIRELPTSVKITAVIHYRHSATQRLSQCSQLAGSLPQHRHHLPQHVPCQGTDMPLSYSSLLPRIARFED